MIWTCESCSGISNADLQRAGAYTPPDDPDATCSECGVPLSAAFRTVLLLERQAQPTASVAAPAPESTTPSGPRLHSFHEAAKLLRVDRVKTLPALVSAGILRAVPWGPYERRIVAEDVERVLREGLATFPGRARKPPKGPLPTPAPPPIRRRRRRARSSNVGDSIRSIDID